MTTPTVNPMFAKFDKALGVTTPTGSAPAPSSRAAEIRALGASGGDASKPRLGEGPAGDFAGNAVRTVAEPLMKLGGGIQKILTGGAAKNTGIEAADESSKAHADGVSGMLGDVVGTVAPYFTGVGEEETAMRVATFIPKLAEKIGVSVDSLIPKITEYLAKRAPDIVKNTAIGTAQTGDIKQGLVNAGGVEVLSGAARVAPKIAGAFKGKTVEEILATPENKLAGLSPEDRTTYFDAQRETADQAHTTAHEAITQKSTQMETQIKAEGEKKIADLDRQTQDLVNKADRASIDEAQSLKPKVIKAMGENSKTYRGLIDKEIAPVRGEAVAHTDLWKFITERNLDNPGNAADLAKRLGLKEGQTSTVGDIYDQLKGLKQDIGSAGKKGSRVFTPDEIKTSDAISVLSDYLKSEKGIDFTEANKFWSKYAPLRDKLIKNVQPFTPQGAESGTFGTFTKDIQNYVSGVKEGKVDFLSATEKLLGTKIGNTETRAALEKLTDNQKAKFAAKLEQENKLTDAKLLKEQQVKEAKGKLTADQKAISDKEFEAARQAKTRKNILRTLEWAGGGLVTYEGLRRLTGI